MYLSNVEGHPALATLAARLGGSPYHLQRNFKRLVGVSPREYAEACRLGKVKRGLRQSDDITGAMFDAGYGSSSRFYERAVPKLGMAPSVYRRGGAGMQHSVHDRRFVQRRARAAARRRDAARRVRGGDGRVRRRPDARPVARVSGGDHRRRTPARSQDRPTPSSRIWPGGEPRLDLPLDVQATAFQWQVWQALAAIPYGETRTYGEVAASIGRPRAVRAVARACATNPVALAIPCHRVVPAAGGTGGYRWGVARKKALLATERRA